MYSNHYQAIYSRSGIAIGKIGSGNAFNFGPKSDQIKTVIELLESLSKNWDMNQNQSDLIKINKSFEGITHEAGLLKLNCDKVLSKINWKLFLNLKRQ